MFKKHRNLNHLKTLIIGTIEQNRTEALSYYISKLPQDLKRKSEYLYFAVYKNKPECVSILKEQGIEPDSSFLHAVYVCKLEHIKDVCDILISLGFEISDSYKKNIIKRIIEPYKIEIDPNRFSIAIKYLDDGFFTYEQFNHATKSFLDKFKPNSKYAGLLISAKRESLLNKLL